MAKIVKAFRKIIVVLVAVPIFIIGVVLIPLPGPGLLICLLALIILATEFEWARKHAENIKDKIKNIFETAASKK